MNALTNKSLLLSVLFSLSACSTLDQQQDSAVQPGADVELPYQVPAPAVGELDSELVFNALAGEIALQRGDLKAAYQHLLQTAIQAGDAVAAEKATKVARLLKDDDKALAAVQRWMELAPNNPAARLKAVVLHFDGGQFERAYEQIEALHAISTARKQNAYMPLMAVLSKRQNRAEAMRLMRRYKAAHEDDPEAGYALSMLSLAWKDYATAEADAARINARRPDWSRGWILHSRLRKLQGDSEGAVRELERALANAPEDVDLNAALARLLVELNRYEEAFRRFQSVHRLAPEKTDVLYSLGVLAMQMERLDDARGYFQRLWESGSHRHDAAYYLGRIEEQQGARDAALGWFKKVNRGDYQFQAKARVAQLLAASGKLQEARDWIQNMRIQMPSQSVRLYILEARMLADNNDIEKVFSLYAKALGAHPKNDDLLYARGLFAAEQGRLEIMERDLRSVIGRNPGNADALNALGYTLADRTERFEEALQLISRALELNPKSPAIMDSMGWLQFRLGDLNKALEYLQRAFELLPDGEIAAHLGEVFWATGSRDRAEAVWQQILQKEPDNKHVLETRKRLSR